MEHILNIESQIDELFSIFKKIQESNTILFLGAGASVGEKRYLSKEIIKYYEQYLGYSINEEDITKFVDILLAKDDFSRNHFDQFIVNTLQKYEITESHRVLASIPWREIITTNVDLLIEQAYDDLAKNHKNYFDLKVIRKHKEYYYKESKSEIKLIKLNGCIQDISKYPLIFSSEDFQNQNKYHKTVLNDTKNLSNAISFLSFGYSFSDVFGSHLLQSFDKYNYRDKKWILNVDPFPNDKALDYYKKNKILIIKCSFQEFFMKYKEWDDENKDILVKKKKLAIRNSEDYIITLPPKLLLNIEGYIKQLNIHTPERFIKDTDYYEGEEPTFNIITRGIDVIKSLQLDKLFKLFEEVLKENSATFVPLFFVTGDFGIGKSTFTLRFIYELEKKVNLDLVAFEIMNFNGLKKEDIIDLVLQCKSKNIIFYCDDVEIESYFKSLIDFQRDLSIEQFQDCNVMFIISIRENILEMYKSSRNIPNSFTFKIDGTFESDELNDLLERLKNTNLINFRDAQEKKKLFDKINSEYNADSFVSLMSIITSGKHENDLISCYNQLSDETKKAFLFTALIHKYKLLMPASWLKNNISMSWDNFIDKVVKSEGKGILIQEETNSGGTQPDLFFRTKHPLIANRLVDIFIQNRDIRFKMYIKMLRSIDIGQTNSYLVNNLLKSLIKDNEYNDIQMNTLFDAAFTKLNDDPYFLLNYAINLQRRHTKKNILKAIQLIRYAESLLNYRNHRFIHRRAVLNFEMTKIYFQEEKELNFTKIYLKEAKELFVIKQMIDQFSAYSYFDYINLLIWELENIQMDKEDEFQRQILIDDLFDLAKKYVTYGFERIEALITKYSDYIKNVSSDSDYVSYLEDIYAQLKFRPYACILLYNYHNLNNNISTCNDLISELESYTDNFEVVKFLHKYYGLRLYEPNIRIKFFKLSSENPNLENVNPLRYNYFYFVAESYNNHYFEGKKYLEAIKSKYFTFNPDFHLIWKDSDGDDLLFDAQIIRKYGSKYKAIKISSIQLTARLKKGNYEDFQINEIVKIKLHFYLYGIMAEIVND